MLFNEKKRERGTGHIRTVWTPFLECTCSTVSLEIRLGAKWDVGMGDRNAAFPTCFQH